MASPLPEFASITAARRVQVLSAVAQAPSPGDASGASAVESTLNVAAPAAAAGSANPTMASVAATTMRVARVPVSTPASRSVNGEGSHSARSDAPPGSAAKPSRVLVGVAQLVELLVVVQAVAGSSPVAHPSQKSLQRRGLPALRFSAARS